jgi:hypothetical protein
LDKEARPFRGVQPFISAWLQITLKENGQLQGEGEPPILRRLYNYRPEGL